MTLEEMLEDLPKVCDIGVKRNAKGHQESWTGYKLHLDAIDGGIPVSCLLTSASVHDSQAAIPLATLTSRRVDSLYDLMDSAYDTPEIRAFSEKLGHVAIIDVNPRRRAEMKAERKREALAERCIGHLSPEARRYRERSTVERVNGRLKDEFGGRHVRVRGPGKVMCHLMFGIPGPDGGTVEELLPQIPDKQDKNPPCRADHPRVKLGCFRPPPVIRPDRALPRPNFAKALLVVSDKSAPALLCGSYKSETIRNR